MKKSPFGKGDGGGFFHKSPDKSLLAPFKKGGMVRKSLVLNVLIALRNIEWLPLQKSLFLICSGQ